jgi:hypothetical protein
MKPGGGGGGGLGFQRVSPPLWSTAFPSDSSGVAQRTPAGPWAATDRQAGGGEEVDQRGSHQVARLRAGAGRRDAATAQDRREAATAQD